MNDTPNTILVLPSPISDDPVIVNVAHIEWAEASGSRETLISSHGGGIRCSVSLREFLDLLSYCEGVCVLHTESILTHWRTKQTAATTKEAP